MSSTSYQDELNYLRELGKEFADRYPDTAHMLGQGARDPDVERLLQGFAFLTARLHDRLDQAQAPDLLAQGEQFGFQLARVLDLLEEGARLGLDRRSRLQERADRGVVAALDFAHRGLAAGQRPDGAGQEQQ